METITGAIDYNDSVLSELADYSAWRKANSDHSFSIVDYAACICSADGLIAYSTVFYPALVLHEGRYFRRQSFSLKAYEDWMRHLKDPARVQSVMNHIDVAALVGESTDSLGVARAVASVIGAIWDGVFSQFRLKSVITDGASMEDITVTLVNR